MVVLFGTGSEIYETDGNMSNADSEKEENLQEMYGIIDNLSSDTAVTVIRSDLLEQKITTVLDDQYRETSTSDLAGGDKGWRLSLTPRERIVKDIEVYNGTVFFNTTIIKPMEQPPANAVCFASEAQGSGWSMELKAATGAMPGIKDAHIHTMTDGSGVTKSVSGLYIKGFTLGAPSIIKPTINAHTNQPYAHDYNGVRTVSGQAGFGLKSLLSGKYLGSRPGQEKGLRAAKCVKAENEQKAWIAIPDSSAGKDQENIPYVGKEILGGCHLGGSVVKRLSWRRIY